MTVHWGEGTKSEEEMLHKSENGQGSLDGSDNKINTDINTTGTVEEDIQSIKDALTRKESLVLCRLRALVILILVLVGISISLGVLYMERKAHTTQFQAAFYGVAGKIIDSLEEVTDAISGLSALAVMATVESEHQEECSSENMTHQSSHKSSDWPLIAVDAFQERANNVRSLSKSIFVSINPIVASDDVMAWEKYVQSDANNWITQGLQMQEEKGLDNFTSSSRNATSWLTNRTVDPLHTFDATGIPRFSDGKGPFLPRWQTSPVLTTNLVNENLMEDIVVAHQMKTCISTKSVVLGGFHSAPPGSLSHHDAMTSRLATLLSMWEGNEVEYDGDPVAHIVIPIFEHRGDASSIVVGVVESWIYWRWFMRGILPKDSIGVTVVIRNNCSGSFTYQVDGPESRPIGIGDRHDHKYSSYGVHGSLNKHIIHDGTVRGVPFNEEACPYSFHVYPNSNAYDQYVSDRPYIIMSALAVVFAFTIGMFLTYDRLVERRQRLLLAKATQSTALVASLFPKQVRDRLLAPETQKAEEQRRAGEGGILNPAIHVKRKFFNEISHSTTLNDQPIADFFPSCTVFFADIAGFTAWSSTREPSQVFFLLQTVYQNFDAIAKRRKVFKVETIGDSYVAVTGLPEPQPKHAVIMVRFAWDCLVRMGELTKELEITLGPDTNDLTMRFGLHSGSVTAGVLKGDRARFQLFGDTVNTASRMESTGMKGRIQVSEETAELLRKDGKGSWLTQRIDQVHAKGKGTLTTYWVTVENHCSTGSTTTGSSEEEQVILPANDQNLTPMTSKVSQDRVEAKNAKSESRRVDWMTKVMLQHISTIASVRDETAPGVAHLNTDSDSNMVFEAPEGTICLDEVQDAIVMPEFDEDVADAMQKANLVEVPNEIKSQLREYVALIARSYRQNPFHNFEHACHVVMSVSKLLRRIVAHDVTSNATITATQFNKSRFDLAVDIHNFTYGLTSDPLASFAIVFSALVHDVDHQGISNEQLIQEEPDMGQHYRNRCVAEQNAIAVAWDLFMCPQFLELRRYIFHSHEELIRFRQIVVNNVIATDIFDVENGHQRRARWDKAFNNDGSVPQETINNLKATIIMEHIMQASDICHTMQHWHVYIKWNRKLFTEMYQAWKEGRMAADPREFWYKGELRFFDSYVIPLAKKLRECNVFGVSSDEYLGYALRNRAEWEERGEEMVRGMIYEYEDANGCFPVTEATTEGSFSDSY